MEELSFFEQAGYSKEAAKQLEKLCLYNQIDYYSMLNALKGFKKDNSGLKALEIINNLE